MINTKIDANQVSQDPINRDSYKANFIVHKIPEILTLPAHEKDGIHSAPIGVVA